MNTALSTTQTARTTRLKTGTAARIGRTLAHHFDTALVLSLIASSAAYAVITLAQLV